MPVAITNCLNFGNPYKPGVYWQFKEAIAGIAEACRVLETPVTGGNVSFYNESPATSVYPTPVIGMLGVLEDVRKATSAYFKRPGDAVLLLGATRGHLGGSEYLSSIHGILCGDAPAIDLAAEKSLQRLLVKLIDQGLLASAHDCSEGGLAVAMAECAIMCRDKQLGARIVLDWAGLRKDAALFGEDQSRVIVSVDPENVARVTRASKAAGVPVTEIGEVLEARVLAIRGVGSISLADLDAAYFDSITEKMQVL
jgi:phosphoribosylformylglycinamidine synthase